MSPGPGLAIDAHWETASIRLLVLCDRPGASQQVHLFRALRRLRASKDCGLAIFSEEFAPFKSPGGEADFSARLAALQPHVVIVSRFAGDFTQKLLLAARSRSIPILAHFDDYLLDVPADLGAEKVKQHMRPERLAAHRASLELANLLYISTQPLLDRIRRAGFRTPAVVSELQSCADPDELAPPRHFDPETSDAVRIGYQGTSSHRKDLALVAPAILEVMRLRENCTFTLFGNIEPPDSLKALGSRIEHVTSTSDYDGFLKRLQSMKWDIGLAPLRDLEFNTYRTFTKWTEYSIAGAAVMATDSVVYRSVMKDGAGVLIRNNQWRDGLLRLVDEPVTRRDMVDRAQHSLRTKYTLEAQERQVLAAVARIAPSLFRESRV